MVKANNINGVLEPISGSSAESVMETPAPEIIQTLPDSFNSMIGQSIDIETDHAQEIIGLLGRMLGIEDYRTNLATFWLLDTMAFEVLRIKHKMNPVNLAIVVSWIAGEAKLIRDKRLTRREFFREMGFIFAKVADQLGKGGPLIYWEEIIGIDSSPATQPEFREDEQEGFPARPNAELRSTLPSDESAEHKNSELTTAGTSDGVEKVYSRHSSSLSQKFDLVLASSMEVFEAIVESTYAVYANAFHYESVSAAFVQPIELHSYRLPYTLRFPRLVQLPVSLSVKSEAPSEGVRGKARSKTDKGNAGKSKGKEKGKSKSSLEIPPPPPSMTDEEMLAQKRKCILPLMESNEAPRLLEQFAQPQSVSLIAETRLNKKTKQKAK